MIRRISRSVKRIARFVATNYVIRVVECGATERKGESMPVAVGIGLTNECNLACPHCYRPTLTRQRLSLPQVETILDNLEVGSVNLGVGENGVHPEYQGDAEALPRQGGEDRDHLERLQPGHARPTRSYRVSTPSSSPSISPPRKRWTSSGARERGRWR